MSPHPFSATAPLVTGAEYVAQMTTSKSDVDARAAFQRLVLKIAPPGAHLLDFGSGPGLDARFYASHGLNVTAYDVDARMCEYFAAHCRDLIEADRVRLQRETYRDFITRDVEIAECGYDLVTANFAPLNLIADLPELFSRFHELTGPQGKVLASVLSPYYLGDMRYPWWWRHLVRLIRTGHYSVPGAQAPIVRRRLGSFRSQSAPSFSLSRVFRGLPSKHDDGLPAAEKNPANPGAPAASPPGNRSGDFAWLRGLSSRFLFLLFEKRGSIHGTTGPMSTTSRNDARARAKPEVR